MSRSDMYGISRGMSGNVEIHFQFVGPLSPLARKPEPQMTFVTITEVQ
jgi:hypothetical protein